MIDSLFDKPTMKKYNALAQKQAKLNAQKNDLAKKSMEKLDPETLEKVLEIVKKYGHPNEIRITEKIEKRYFSGEELEFDDLLNLDSLYKSNFKKFSNKDVSNE